MHSHDFLTVDVESEQFLFFLKAHADHIAFNISKSQYAFLIVDSQRGNLVLMIEECIFVIEDTSHIAEGFDRAIP